MHIKDADQTNYLRIATAIEYINAHFKEQPCLVEIAAVVGLSPSHFQRLFSEWAGVSPKKFIQYLSLDYAKQILKDGQTSLLDTAYESGLSGTSRLHDLFINIESMTPGEFKNSGQNLLINYSFADSPFGKIIVASTTKGICHLAFYEDEIIALSNLKTTFKNANYRHAIDDFHRNAVRIFDYELNDINQIKLHLKGSEFQLKVWESLLKLPSASLATYSSIANEIKRPKAFRAVGSAIGNNPVAFLIPCHRVIQKSGNLGGYMWGDTRKSAIIGWEAAQNNRVTVNKNTQI